MAPWCPHGVSRGQVDVPGARNAGRRSHGITASTWLIHEAHSGQPRGLWREEIRGGHSALRAKGLRQPGCGGRSGHPGGTRGSQEASAPEPWGEGEGGSGPARPGGDGGSSLRGWQGRVDSEHRGGRGRTGAEGLRALQNSPGGLGGQRGRQPGPGGCSVGCAFSSRAPRLHERRNRFTLGKNSLTWLLPHVLAEKAMLQLESHKPQ